MPTLKPLGSLLNAPDYADRVNLIKKIKTASGWRFAPVIPEANGRLKDRVRINGQIEVHPEGAYYIEWRVGGRRGSPLSHCRRQRRGYRPGPPQGHRATRHPRRPHCRSRAGAGGCAQDDNRRCNRRLSPICEDAAQTSHPSDLPLHARHPAPCRLQKEVRRGRDPRRRARLHDLLL